MSELPCASGRLGIYPYSFDATSPNGSWAVGIAVGPITHAKCYVSLDITAATVEAAIDVAHRTHPLLSRSYADAMAQVLLSAEEIIFNDAASLEKQDQSISLTSVVNALKYATAWITSVTDRRKPDGISPHGLQEAHDLLKQATAYLLVVGALISLC